VVKVGFLVYFQILEESFQLFLVQFNSGLVRLALCGPYCV
jgi:hypothetical protein